MQKRKLWPLFILLGFCFTLTACDNQLDTANQVKSDTQTILKKVRAQKKLITALEKQTESLPDQYATEIADKPDTNLLKDSTSKLYKTFNTRQADYATFTDNQKQVDEIDKRLVRVSKRKLTQIPNENLKNLLQSLKISALDHTTLDTFMSETLTDEKEIYSSALSGSDLKNELSRLSQYYGAINQQLEIMNANLSTVIYQCKQVLNNLK